MPVYEGEDYLEIDGFFYCTTYTKGPKFLQKIIINYQYK